MQKQSDPPDNTITGRHGASAPSGPGRAAPRRTGGSSSESGATSTVSLTQVGARRALSLGWSDTEQQLSLFRIIGSDLQRSPREPHPGRRPARQIAVVARLGAATPALRVLAVICHTHYVSFTQAGAWSRPWCARQLEWLNGSGS
jgi:hypothetical protein